MNINELVTPLSEIRTKLGDMRLFIRRDGDSEFSRIFSIDVDDSGGDPVVIIEIDAPAD
jgi:glycosyltransferase A (GT-A) superfamily protein (DUF2064 family)